MLDQGGDTQIWYTGWGPAACTVQSFLLLKAHYTELKELCVLSLTLGKPLELWGVTRLEADKCDCLIWRNLQVNFIEMAVGWDTVREGTSFWKGETLNVQDFSGTDWSQTSFSSGKCKLGGRACTATWFCFTSDITKLATCKKWNRWLQHFCTSKA